MTAVDGAVWHDTALVLVLHAHLPWQLRRGAWPHGSDWLGEAVCESYLPLLDALDALAADDVPVRWTLGITPVLAAQLGAADAPTVLQAYVQGRLAASAVLRDDASRDETTRALGAWWHAHYTHCLERLDALGWDLCAAFAAQAAAGRVELMGSAATHAVLPLLAADESVRLQLGLGRLAHERTFGAAPAGCWLPECAYRPRGWWQPAPWAPAPRVRDGIHGFVREAGFAWTIVDAHLPRPVASVRAAQASGAASPVRGSPVAVPARETRTGAGVLAAWAREIAAARATGALPPSVVALQSIARRSVDAGVTGDDRDVRPARVATQQWPMALATNGDATRASEALRLAQAAFTNGDAPFASPWPVFDDLEAFLRAVRGAGDDTSGGAWRGESGAAWRVAAWPGVDASGAALAESGAFAVDSGVAMDSGAFPFTSGVAMESGAFPFASGVAMESGAFPLDSGVAMDSGAFPVTSGMAMDSGGFPLDSGIAMDSGAFAHESGAFALDSGAALASGAAPLLAARVRVGDPLASMRIDAPLDAASTLGAAPTAVDAALRLTLPASWPHGLHQWRGPFIGAGAVTTGAWRETLHAVAPAIAHRAWRVAESLDETADSTSSATHAIGGGAFHVLVRDPVSARLVWSRQGGYPASSEYLEFHRRDERTGFRLWRVTSHAVSQDGKEAYVPANAEAAAMRHAAHFAQSMRSLAATGAQVVVAPFDAELFGHWWREGPAFLAQVARELATGTTQASSPPIRLVHASEVLHGGDDAAAPAVLDAGSWGALGSFAMWLNERTAWLWRRLWPLELRFWAVARTAIAHAPRHAVLVQAARALLLAQSSDWPFMLTRDEAADHAARRATAHLDACEALVTALEALAVDAAPDERLVAARALAAEQARLDDPFHDDDVLAALQGALAAGPTPGGASRRTSLAVAPVVADATGDGGAAAVAA